MSKLYTSTTHQMELTEGQKEFITHVTGIDSVEIAFEHFCVSCAMYFMEADEILEKVKSSPSYSEFISGAYDV